MGFSFQVGAHQLLIQGQEFNSLIHIVLSSSYHCVSMSRVKERVENQRESMCILRYYITPKQWKIIALLKQGKQMDIAVWTA